MAGPDIQLKTTMEVLKLRKPGSALHMLFRHLLPVIVDGVTTRRLEEISYAFLVRNRVKPNQKGYKGFPAFICSSVNAICAHGIPGDEHLRAGDIVTIDVTGSVDGWCADAAWTYLVRESRSGNAVGRPSPSPTADQEVVSRRRLIYAAWITTMAGIRAATAGSRLGDVGATIRSVSLRLGCNVLSAFTGHGIGRRIHEPPAVLNDGEIGMGRPIVPGMVITIEPILTYGSNQTILGEDKWGYRTVDGSPTAQFEHTVAIGRYATEILTLPNKKSSDVIDAPPFF